MQEAESTVYFCTNIQSGNQFYTAYEPEGYELEYLYVREAPYSSVPSWGLKELEQE